MFEIFVVYLFELNFFLFLFLNVFLLSSDIHTFTKSTCIYPLFYNFIPIKYLDMQCHVLLLSSYLYSTLERMSIRIPVGLKYVLCAGK